MSDIQRFPKMIYHANGETVVVHTQAQLSAYLALGWSEVPEEYSEKEAIKYKIKLLQREIGELEDRLKELEEVITPPVAKRPAEHPAPTPSMEKELGLSEIDFDGDDTDITAAGAPKLKSPPPTPPPKGAKKT